MEKTTFTRQELYELVWTTPLIQLARKYNISDNGLRKICKRVNIPLPDSGYWSKLKFNKPVSKPELPTEYSGEKEISLTERDDDTSIINSTTQKLKTIRESYETLNKSFFKVPDRLTNPDKLIVAAQKSLSAEKATEWSKGLVGTYSGELTINVAPKNVGRALRLFDTIIKLLHYRGHKIDIEGKETYAIIFSEKIEIALREKLRIEKIEGKYSWDNYKYFPTDKLIFKVDRIHVKEFHENSSPLEEQLRSILAYLEYTGQKQKENRIEREIYWQKEKERQRIEAEHKERKEKELQNFKNLLKESQSWHKSVILDNYIKEVEKRAIENNSFTEELKTWLKWAKEKADWFNPFIRKDDEYLSVNDRFNL